MAATNIDVHHHNATVLNTLNDGDLVEFSRQGMHSHWGVYIGNQQIVHLTGVDGAGTMDASAPGSSFSISGVIFPKACVMIEDFFKVANGCIARRNNGKDSEFSPLHPSEIVRKAMEMIGNIGYNILWYNCEHFATFLRYGKKFSGQVETAAALTGVVCATAVFAGVIIHIIADANKSKNKY
ncbi:phospholipase A and acyltransferase 4-like [Pecten maximus]|uniref:phospholipase A and acyltransferase 4-like n=1 Tax=Pecten maximus TaxID=6579 RepID=UPI0014587D56|nr:phospholipase A and acyltransferase 4-like [Pecten maximus]XP_033763541.1 phospholipase A and acyltransferase 4-like [Pecten maximus]